MFAWMRNLFSSAVKAPEIGEIWVMYPSSPWGKNIYAEILDVKDGWVKYKYCNAQGKPKGDLEWDDLIKYFIEIFEKTTQ